MVTGSEAFENDALDIMVDAGNEKIVSVGTGKPGNDTARSRQGKALKRRPALDVWPIDEEFAVEPEEVEGPEGHRH
ncbi:MAG TPA: hypothetical protein VGL92_05785 [Acidimicrobiia bacterium]